MMSRSSTIQQVVRSRSGQHCRQFSSKGNNSNNKKVDILSLQDMKRAPSSELSTMGMISLSAVALSPLTLASRQQNNNLPRRHHDPQSKTIPSRARVQRSATLKELSDLYAPKDRVTMFTGKDIVTESKQLEAEIDEMMLRLGENPKDDGKSGR